MKLKSLFMFTAVALTVAGCSSDNAIDLFTFYLRNRSSEH